MKHSAVAITLMVAVWTPFKPALGPTSYQGPSGWHETVDYKDGKIHLEFSQLRDAIDICAKHGWQGYVRYMSSFGYEVDPCLFMKKVNE